MCAALSIQSVLWALLNVCRWELELCEYIDVLTLTAPLRSASSWGMSGVATHTDNLNSCSKGRTRKHMMHSTWRGRRGMQCSTCRMMALLGMPPAAARRSRALPARLPSPPPRKSGKVSEFAHPGTLFDTVLVHEHYHMYIEGVQLP